MNQDKIQDQTGKTIYRENCVKPVLKGSPSGGCYSTTRDLYNFCISLANNKLISDEYKFEVLSPKPDMCSINYGYGFFINGDSISHSGDGTGINAKLEYNLQTGKVMVILSNYSSPSAQKAFDVCEQHFRTK